MGFIFKLLLTFSVIEILHSASLNEYKTYTNYKVYEIAGSKNDITKMLLILKEIDDTIIYKQNGNTTQVIVSPEIIPALEEIVSEKKLNKQVIIEDYSEVIRLERHIPRGRKEFSWSAYYDVDDIYGYLRKMNATFPNVCSLIVGGLTYEGRKILGLRINTPSETRQIKPAMFIESGIHAREWITPATTTFFINELLTSTNPDIIKMREQFDWHIFPTINPDGYEYSRKVERFWRKTRSKSPNGCYGADPNRNWDYNWLQNGASDNPCNHDTYGGSKPFSEIETRSLSKYISRVENLQGYVAFHADAEMLLLPYSDSVEHIENYDDLKEIGEASLDYGQKSSGRARYSGPATAAEILYKASGGSMDWVRHALGTPVVFTYELRGIHFMWPPSKIPEQGIEVTQMMLGLINEAKSLGYFVENKSMRK